MVIAQDIQPIAPYMVYSVRKKLKDTDVTDTDLLMYDGSALIYILVNAIKEQQQIIEKLGMQENEQNKKIADLESYPGEIENIKAIQELIKETEGVKKNNEKLRSNTQQFQTEIHLLREKQGQEIAILKKQIEEIKKMLGYQ